MRALTRWEPAIRWNPFKELEEMEKRWSSICGRTPSVGTRNDKEAITVAEKSPLVGISEDDREYVITAELPEMKKEDIKLNAHTDVLTITGERKYAKEEKSRENHRVERAYGSLMRSFTLPKDADGTKVTAEYKDGILRVRLPKSDNTLPQAIEVKVS